MKNLRHLIIRIPGLRRDFISEERTPFLHSLCRSARPSLIIPGHWSGSEYPLEYLFTDGQSPYSFLRSVRPLPRILDRLRFDRFVRSWIRKIASRRYGQFSPTAFVPLSQLPYFTPSRWLPRGEFQGFFDELKKALEKLTLRIGGRAKETLESTGICMTRLASLQECHVVVETFGELWLAARTSGPSSAYAARALQRIDQALSSLSAPILDAGGSVTVFGPHGMVEVRRRIPLRELLRQCRARLGRDYLAFIDATHARFRILNKDCAEELLACLSQIQPARILSPREVDTLWPGLSQTQVGDLVFALEEGAINHPSYVAPAKGVQRIVHGYIQKVQDDSGIALLPSSLWSARPYRENLSVTELYEHLVEQLANSDQGQDHIIPTTAG